MKQGAILFAHNNSTTDYYAMAVATARRLNRFLGLPVSIITDRSSITDRTYTFDRTFFIDPDDSNTRKKETWINKGRYQAFDLSPYDRTLLLDTDYMVNSQRLLKLFDLQSDFVCHDSTYWVAQNYPAETLNPSCELGVKSLWATAVRFDKTRRVAQMFHMMEQVQKNYEHYSNIYGFLPYTYRNDYALTIAHKTVNGHVQPSEDFIPWPLVHVSHELQVERDSDTAYTIKFEQGNPARPAYMRVRDWDFHMLGKKNFLELVQ